MSDEIEVMDQDDGGSRKRSRVPTAELDERMSALEERMADLDTRERELAERESAFAERMRVAPREREANIPSRSRAADDTARIERPSMDFYAPPSQLETPSDDQYYYRWIRESVMGSATPANVQQRIRQGYVRVRIDELPEDFVVDEDERGDGFARTSGLMLMRIPLERKRAMDNYHIGRSVERLQSADELQGIAKRDYVREDRGSRSLTGSEAHRMLSGMS